MSKDRHWSHRATEFKLHRHRPLGRSVQTNPPIGQLDLDFGRPQFDTTTVATTATEETQIAGLTQAERALLTLVRAAGRSGYTLRGGVAGQLAAAYELHHRGLIVEVSPRTWRTR